MIEDSYFEEPSIFNKKFSQFVELLKTKKAITVFTGAGVSTLSGIPDFRGKHGVYNDPWQGLDVEKIISISFFKDNPDIFYKWAKDVWYKLENYEPNIVHKTIAKMEKIGLINGVYTQNIDMLHQKAGSKNVYEVHGSPETHHCFHCQKAFSYEEIASQVVADIMPLCPICKGPIKPDIIFYEENLNEEILNRAFRDFSNSDLTIVLGSSLTVQPAASFPLIAKRNGADLVIVNGQQTSMDFMATLCFKDLRQTFEALDKVLD
ncbi:MAG: NAD-dependent protein deacylase [Sphaerochaetaceae bacterium]|nr:NAD-dependent protein deacylase [Sphaerochaetaceae bacterium]